jgi:hypothetical protein
MMVGRRARLIGPCAAHGHAFSKLAANRTFRGDGLTDASAPTNLGASKGCRIASFSGKKKERSFFRQPRLSSTSRRGGPSCPINSKRAQESKKLFCNSVTLSVRTSREGGNTALNLGRESRQEIPGSRKPSIVTARLDVNLASRKSQKII